MIMFGTKIGDEVSLGETSMSNIDLNGKTILVTGAAGFIGGNLVLRLFQNIENVKIVGIDNMNDYYDVRLKEVRLEELTRYASFSFIKGSIEDKMAVTEIFEKQIGRAHV